MKEINTFQLVKVPEGVEATVKARAVTVKGARGSLTKAFKHLSVDIYKVDAETIKVEKWFGKKKELAAVRTVCSHIENMFKGVIKVSAVTEESKALQFSNILHLRDTNTRCELSTLISPSPAPSLRAEL